jgi:peptide/nickel transport system substrate-binding protein
VALPAEPETLHPLYATSRAAQAVVGALYVGCIGQDERGAPVALGCERVPTLDNGDARWIGEGDDRRLDVVFHIRPGWRWTDGQPVTSRDVLFTWQLIMAPEAQVRDPLTQKVFAVSAPDERTVVVQFMSAAQARAAAAGTLRGDVAFEYFGLQGDYARYQEQAEPLSDPQYWAVARWLPSHLLQAIPPREQLTSPFSSAPVGDGAFQMVAWRTGAEITLERSAAPFPLDPQGNVEKIVFLRARDEAEAVQLLQSGQAQLSLPLPLAVVSQTLGAARPAFAAELAAMPAYEQLVFNVERPPFDDVLVRRAARAALDAAAILSDPAIGPAAPPVVIDPAGPLQGAAAGPLAAAGGLSQARALLAEAGWSCEAAPCVKAFTAANGTVVTRALEFTLVTNERSPRNALSQLAQKQLAAAGFGVDIQIVHGLGAASRLFAPYEQEGILQTRAFDAALYQAPALSTFTGAFDCASIPTEAAHGARQGNAGGFCDPAVDALIAQAEGGLAAMTPPAQAQAVASALAAVGEAAPIVALYSPVWVLPSRGVSGVRHLGYTPLTWNAWEWQSQARP